MNLKCYCKIIAAIPFVSLQLTELHLESEINHEIFVIITEFPLPQGRERWAAINDNLWLAAEVCVTTQAPPLLPNCDWFVSWQL